MPADSGSTATSVSLIARAQGNDQDAWKRIVELYSPMVHRWCRLGGVNAVDAPDVVQDVFRSVVRAIHQFTKDSGNGTFRGWLRIITRNKILDHHRKQQKMLDHPVGGSSAQKQLQQCPELLPDDALEEQTDQSLLAHRILELIKHRFKEETWRAFWMVVVEGKDADTVAKTLNISRNATYIAKSRVLRTLRAEIANASEL